MDERTDPTAPTEPGGTAPPEPCDPASSPAEQPPPPRPPSAPPSDPLPGLPSDPPAEPGAEPPSAPPSDPPAGLPSDPLAGLPSDQTADHGAEPASGLPSDPPAAPSSGPATPPSDPAPGLPADRPGARGSEPTAGPPFDAPLAPPPTGPLDAEALRPPPPPGDHSSAGAPPPPPPPAPAGAPSGGVPPYGEPDSGRWQLHRSVGDRKLRGVAGGVAAAAGIDSTLVRILFVVAALSGWGIVAYIVLAFVLKDETPDERARPLPRDQRRVLRIGLAVAGVIAAGRLLDGWFFTGRGMGLPLLLIAAGAAVLWARRDQTEGAGMPAVAGAPQAFASAGEPPWSPPPWPAGSRTAPPDGRVDWRSTGHDLLRLAAAFVAVAGFLALLAGAFLVAVGAVAMRLPFLPFALAAPGLLGLVVSVVRRVPVAGLLISGGVLVAAAALAIALAPFPGGAGDRVIAIGPENPLLDRYEQSAGRLVLDLGELTIEAGGERRVVAEVGAGQLTVIVPPELSASVTAEVGAGTALLFGREQSGAGVTLTGSHTAAEEGAGRVVLDLRVGVGQVKVERPTAPTFQIACDVPADAKGDGTDPVTCPHPARLVGRPMACSVALVDPDRGSAGKAFCRAAGNAVPVVGAYAADCTVPRDSDTADCRPLGAGQLANLARLRASTPPPAPTFVVPPAGVPPLACGPPDPAGVRLCSTAPTSTTAAPTTSAAPGQYRCTEDPSSRQLSCVPA